MLNEFVSCVWFYMDTDSFMLEIKMEEVYEDTAQDISIYDNDTNNDKNDRSLFSTKIKKFLENVMMSWTGR